MLKKYAAITACLFCVVLLGLSLTACEKKPNGEVEILSGNSAVPSVTERKEADKEEIQAPSEEAEQATKNDIKEALKNKKELSVYCIDDGGKGIESVSIFVDEKAQIDAAVVTDAVVNEFSDHNLDIHIDKISEDNDGNVYVSFQKDAPPVKDVEEEIEYFILDCISQSILDNVETCKAVIFQIEGNAYVTDHIQFKETQAYDWK